MTIDDLVRMINGSPWNRYLYHFTDESNFPSIASKGLVSKARMKREGWWPDATGGNQLSWDLDARKGIDAFVSLCMTRNHPLKYLAQKEGRLPDPRYLAVKPDILKRDGVRISLGVANAANVAILPLDEALALGKVDVDVLYRHTDWRDAEVQQRLRAAEKWEILVPDPVPIDFIARAM